MARCASSKTASACRRSGPSGRVPRARSSRRIRIDASRRNGFRSRGGPVRSSTPARPGRPKSAVAMPWSRNGEPHHAIPALGRGRPDGARRPRRLGRLGTAREQRLPPRDGSTPIRSRSSSSWASGTARHSPGEAGSRSIAAKSSASRAIGSTRTTWRRAGTRGRPGPTSSASSPPRWPRARPPAPARPGPSSRPTG